MAAASADAGQPHLCSVEDFATGFHSAREGLLALQAAPPVWEAVLEAEGLQYILWAELAGVCNLDLRTAA